ncbi:RNA-directed DNA polymerase, eukaryota, reverse transcriptase zinc-binding domain protein [Tanacetum coccineum]
MGTWAPTSSKLLIISVYAPQELNERRDLWDYLRTIIDRWEAESIDSYDDLKKAFLENYLQQKKCIKDPIELHNIKQRDGESTKDFVRRYKLESRDVKGAPECMRISGFVHGITNPELIKRLHDKIPKTIDEMMRVTTSFLRGEVAASNHERKKSFPLWKQQESSHRQNFKKGGFRSQQKPERKQDRFTLLTKTPKEIFALEKGKFKAPPSMTTPVEKRNYTKFCEFHGEVRHTTDECMHLKKQIEEMLKAGKLSHLIKEIKQNSGKEQPKAVKKGKPSGKDKVLAVLMVQPWERMANYTLGYHIIKFKIWSVLLLMKRSKGLFEIMAPTNHLGQMDFPLNFTVDFEKAFDYVKWDYLDETLKAFGFGLKWRNWISSCLNNAMGSVLVNGSPTLEFQFHKGLKQGLKINLHKSKLMGIGVSSNVVAAAASLIGCYILTAPFNYLGVKVGSNMSRINSWGDVISKVPIGVLNHLESIRRNFFYGVDGSDRKLAWIGWNMVLTSKKNGGLGVSRALDTHKLIPRRSPWQDVILAIHSLQSKGINLMDFIQKKVGNGENTSFWDDSWLGEVALKVLYKRLYALEMCKSISVAEKMGHPSLSHSFRRMPRGGVEQENYGLLCSKVADLVLPNISDRWCWSLEGSQEFSVKSSRILIDNTILPKAEVPTRWLRVVPIKVNVHAWRVCLDKLPTRANLSLRGMDIPSIACPLCNSAVESTSHIFFACPLARQVWRNFLIWWELEDVAFNSYNEWLNWIVNIRLHKQLKVFLEGIRHDSQIKVLRENVKKDCWISASSHLVIFYPKGHEGVMN